MALLDAVPLDGYVRRDEGGRRTGKRYRNFSRELVRPGRRDDHGLPEPWRELVSDVLSPDYREQVSRLLEQPPATGIEMRLVRHAPGDWLGPHTDRDDKLFSHILYFNSGWREEWGGCLEILTSADPTSVVGRVVPRLGASALLAREEHSWHQVTRVCETVTESRVSLLVHGLR
ncbi:MAG TPA: 2OG-Fe(II) oxygenase family protein [Streptosporangiaceae bacterium]|nr:2OG-Fe(II) oxygenase family protein [Streptosporangiaceae bacterium]